jgi:hypothetical protein
MKNVPSLDIWNIYDGLLVYFNGHFVARFSVLFQEKSGNPAVLATSRRGEKIVNFHEKAML